MSNLDEKVLNYLKGNFEKVRRTKEGIKINVQQLSGVDIKWLNGIECKNEILIKRSGTGLVIIIE